MVNTLPSTVVGVEYFQQHTAEHVISRQKQVVHFRTQTALPRSVTVSILRMTVCTISDNESNIV